MLNAVYNRPILTDYSNILSIGIDKLNRISRAADIRRKRMIPAYQIY